MSGPRLALDGLWRCLCPSVSPAVASRVLLAPATPRSLLRRPACATPLRPQQRRRHGTATGTTSPFQHVHHTASTPAGYSHATSHDAVEAILRASPGDLDLQNVIRRTSTSDLVTALHELSGRPNGFPTAAVVTEHLVRERQVPLDPDIYQCLVACCRDTKASADMLANLLGDMRELRLPYGVLLSHDALEALAIHPNYLLRNEILDAMDRSWSALDASGRCSVALGLLRDGQIEMALDAVDAMTASSDPPPPHLYDIFVLTLTHQGFLDEAVRMAHDKLHATARELPRTLWHLLLDACSRAFHVPGTQYVWARLPAADRARIPSGTLLNILNTAARGADPDTAAEALQAMAARGTSLTVHHYEALVDAFAAHGDVDSALRTLCIMHAALAAVPDASTRSLLALLRAQPALIDTALAALARLLADRPVPIQAANVVLEAAALTRGFAAAFDIYNTLPLYTHDRPTLATLAHLLRVCDDARALRYIVTEQPRLALAASPVMFDRAVADFAVTGDLDRAYDCVAMFADTEDAPWLSRDTALALIRSSIEAADARVWPLINAAKARGLGLEASLTRLMGSVQWPDRRELTAGRREVRGTDEEEVP